MKIFLVGIGGIAMGNLAYMLKNQGHDVSGSDQNLYPPMSDKLVEWGLSPKSGYRKENVKGADLVIIGNAISRGNPEVEEVLNTGMEYMSMAQAIGTFFLKNKKPIVISGTHGKTTTTFLTHWILESIGLKPGLFVGGIRKDGFPGFALGEGDYFVIEGDEYDSAFFDKSSKFLHYRPYYLAMNALDFDHADIFADLNAIKTMFKRLLNLVPGRGKVFYWKGSRNLVEITKDYKHAPVESFDLGDKNSIFKYEKGVLSEIRTKTKLKPSLIGSHNYRNVEVATRICLEIAPQKRKEILEAVVSFPGVKRRQENLFVSDKSLLVEDFAHHPVAIQETIRAHKEAYPGYKIISLFEPRSATSHRNIFQDDFAKCFKGSDVSIITEVYQVDKVNKSLRLNVKKLVKDISKNTKKDALYAKDPKEIPVLLKKILPKFQKEKVIILAMSNGAFGGIYPELKSLIELRESV
ncbi:UDP-N-acetylmuramate--L-alanine ligase [Leptospira harrisiae]|uniref:UDP-N-acetylmuramate--alanine ligase n=1 Tax=Leptospira harrisiae TaxID=2023189 RepID=A0A2N0AL55_9LEPT|nr:Mur ligase domain-containing protein [Leptospira harrisiae]PJZ84967.1 UDP-N-acetylmuramate--alanine ligase [Leptospira harrisiae]PKA08470.1 UDP-N-acetylmuramate--alanine ligase [Leptospira harrisiae]